MEQDRIENAIEKLLQSVDRPGDFCSHGRLFAPMPRLEVKGAGLLSFPVPEAQIRALIAAAERAPYRQGAGKRCSTRRFATAGRSMPGGCDWGALRGRRRSPGSSARRRPASGALRTGSTRNSTSC